MAALPGTALGLASASTNKIWLDIDGAGHGWSTGEDTSGMDLLSAVTHEFGHMLGFNHKVMGDEIHAGERHRAADYVVLARASAEVATQLPPKPLRTLDTVFEVLDEARSIVLQDQRVGKPSPADVQRFVPAHWSVSMRERPLSQRLAAIDSVIAGLADEEHSQSGRIVRSISDFALFPAIS